MASPFQQIQLGVLVGKSQERDSADDVAEWKLLLTPEELQLRRSFQLKGTEPPRISSDQIIVRNLKYEAKKQRWPVRAEAIDSEKIKSLSSSKIIQIFNQYDFIVLLTTTPMYEARTLEAYEKFFEVIEKTKAITYPRPGYLKFLFDKAEYMKLLQSVGIPIIPSKYWHKSERENQVHNNWSEALAEIKKYAEIWNTNLLITKPSHAAGKVRNMQWDMTDPKIILGLKKWFENIYSDFQESCILIQPYLETFALGKEIRTFWLKEKFAYAVETEPPSMLKPADLSHHDWKKHPILNKLVPIGERVLETLPFDGTSPKILVRIDFGQELLTDHETFNPKWNTQYFVNEIEMIEACLFPDWTRYDIIKELSDAIMKVCLKKGFS